MAEELLISSSTDKSARYATLIPQIEALVSDEPDFIANLSNIAAALKQTMDFFWVGHCLQLGIQIRNCSSGFCKRRSASCAGCGQRQSK